VRRLPVADSHADAKALSLSDADPSPDAGLDGHPEAHGGTHVDTCTANYDLDSGTDAEPGDFIQSETHEHVVYHQHYDGRLVACVTGRNARLSVIQCPECGAAISIWLKPASKL